MNDPGLALIVEGPFEKRRQLVFVEKIVVSRARTKRPIALKGRGVKARGPVAELVSDMRRDRDERVLG